MPRPPRTEPVACPFTVAIDTREQRPYSFEGLEANASQGHAPIAVPTVRATLPTGCGDYSIVELPRIGIERKSKEDLFGSIGRARENFERRLELMSRLDAAFVVVEAEVSEILADPPRHTRVSPKSILRTIDAWKQRYRLVHWEFLPGREMGMAKTFRLLERFWLDRQGDPR